MDDPSNHQSNPISEGDQVEEGLVVAAVLDVLLQETEAVVLSGGLSADYRTVFGKFSIGQHLGSISGIGTVLLFDPREELLKALFALAEGLNVGSDASHFAALVLDEEAVVDALGAFEDLPVTDSFE